MAVYAREKELAVKRSSEPKAPLAKGILAPVKTRIRDLEITITSVGQSESEWGWSTRVVGRTPDHHLILWWAKGRIDDWEAGDVLVLDAKVKGLKPFTGRDGETIDQTVIYYAKVIEIPTPRWTAYDALRFNIKLTDNVPMTTQERAYTSPIWYTP